MNPTDVIQEFSDTIRAGNFVKIHESIDNGNFGNWISEYQSSKYSLKFVLEKGELFLEIQDNEFGKYHDLRIVCGYLKRDSSVCSIIYPPATYRGMLEEIIDGLSRAGDASERLKVWESIESYESDYRKDMFKVEP